MIDKIYIFNYKIFQNFLLDFNEDLNLVVGDNETGKSTILEAINLALTKRLNGRFVEYEISPFIFNKQSVTNYLEAYKKGKPIQPPEILIELFFKDSAALSSLKGSNNSLKEDVPGLKLQICFDSAFNDEYEKLIKSDVDLKYVPSEYYKVVWYSFANNAVTIRSIPLRCSFIDTTTIRMQSGNDFYLQDIINNSLEAKEKVGLSVSYRGLKEHFSGLQAIRDINDRLTQKKGMLTDKALSISLDISQKSNWENSLVPHLDELPFQFSGKGEQNALKIMLALEHRATDSNIILIEEPENHLSFSSLNILIRKIKDKCSGKQIFITTHSAFVLNKLGLNHLILLNGSKAIKLNGLTADTQNYFSKLSGYDTLRIALAKKAILVEGPSDELIVQKAYFKKHSKLPIENGIDVLNVRGLSFLRFLEIAEGLEKQAIVVSDNDGDYANKIEKKYEAYKNSKYVKICASNDLTLTTLEPQMLGVNSRDKLNRIFGTNHSSDSILLNYMINNKSEWAIKIFDSNEDIEFPQYIKDATE